MSCAYAPWYLADAQDCLSVALDYAVCDCGLDADAFAAMFVTSGYAALFEQGNPRVVAGMSGYELVWAVLDSELPGHDAPEPTLAERLSPEYWAGWALADYQWRTGRRFRDVFASLACSRVVRMYHPYHEMDVTRFAEAVDELLAERQQRTRLARIREERRLTQADLAEQSGVHLRSIQMYEQRHNDVNKAQAESLYRLSRTLGCTIEDLLEG